MKTLEKLTPKSVEFQAGGKTYFIQLDQLSVKRYEVYQVLSPKLGFGVSIGDHFNRYKNIHKALSTGNDVMGAITKSYKLAYEGMQAVKDFNERKYLDVLMLCALFCNTADEDISDFNEAKMIKKCEDFENSNIHIESFFLLARLAMMEFNECLDYINQISPEK